MYFKHSYYVGIVRKLKTCIDSKSSFCVLSNLFSVLVLGTSHTIIFVLQCVHIKLSSICISISAFFSF